MNEYIAEITLDLDCRKSPPRIAAGQYDKGRKCLIHITANDIAYSAAGATAVIKGRRKDKSYFSENCTIDNSGNVVFTMSEAALAVSGFAYAKVVLSDSTKTYSTQLFILDVDNGLEGDVTEIDSYSVFNDCLRLLAELLGVSDATSRLDQYITVDDVLNSLTHADTDNVFSAEFTADRFIHKYAIAGSSLPETTISKTALGKLPLRHTVAVNEDGKWFVPVSYTIGSESYTDIVWKRIGTEADFANYVPTARTFAGLSLAQDRSAWAVVNAIISGIISFGSTDKEATETYNGSSSTLPYHVDHLYINTTNKKAWICTEIKSSSGNPPYIFHWQKATMDRSDLEDYTIPRIVSESAPPSGYTNKSYPVPCFWQNGIQLYLISGRSQVPNQGYVYTAQRIGTIYIDSGSTPSKDPVYDGQIGFLAGKENNNVIYGKDEDWISLADLTYVDGIGNRVTALETNLTAAVTTLSNINTALSSRLNGV